MPIEFLTEEQKRQYGQFADEPSSDQLSRYFHIDKTDLSLINKCRRDYNRLGFALQLTTVRFLGTFLPDPTQVPVSTIHFVAHQLDIKNVGSLKNYLLRKSTRYAHSTEIQQYYGYHDFNIPPWRFRLSRLLYSRSWFGNERPGLMFDFATSWLIQNKVLLPGITTLSRLVSEIRERANKRLWKRLFLLPNDVQKEKLETIFQIYGKTPNSRFDHYKKSPVTISTASFTKALERYNELKDYGIQKLDFSHIPPIHLKNLARYASITSMHKIIRMPDEKRIAILVAFVKSFETTALDDALDVLDLLITDIASDAQKADREKRLRTLKDLDKSALALAEICSIILNEETRDEQLRELIFAKFSKTELEASIATIHNLARPAGEKFHDEIVAQYNKAKKFLPKLLKSVNFESTQSGTSTINALRYLAKLGNSRKQILENPPLGIVDKSWKSLVFDKDGRVIRKGYVFCFLDKLRDNLRRRDVYVENSDRWGDPRAKLIQDSDWKATRLQICRSLGHSLSPDEAVSNLIRQLDTTYKRVAANFAGNDAIEIDRTGKHPTLTIKNLDDLEKPPSLKQLSKKITELLPKVDLTELLLEIHAHTGFADEFTHVSELNARVDDLAISVCAVLMAEACNIGFESLTKHHVPALTRHRLSWVKQNYMRAETLIQANARLVDHQATLSLAQKWGGGEVASADGLRFVTPVKTINARPNRKYFGSQRGLTWYNFISDQYSGFHGIVIPGTLRDSIFVLEGVLEQQTGLKPNEIMTDTAGSSDMVFGLFWLLGYQFSPRMADAGEATFWRADKKADYGILNGIARSNINIRKINQHWDDMLRIAGSLKLGTIQASELIRSLLRSKRPSSLAQAIIELGHINKTIYLLNYIDSEEYRRRILTQLNRGEGRHFVARSICHGKRGEIRKRYREGQEDQLGTLGLVTNAVVLWNTIYMQASLNHLQQQSFEIKEEDEIRLSPLLHKHINMLGHYSFTLTDQITSGKLRPLNEISTYLDYSLE